MMTVSREPYNKKYWLCAKIIAAGIVIWLLTQSAQLKFGLVYTLLDKPVFTLVSLGLLYAAVFFNTWRWYRLNTAQEITLSLTKTFIPTYLGVAFNTILPGNLGGDVLRIYQLIKKFPQKKSGIILSTFLDRFSGLMGIFFISCLAALLHWQAITQSDTLAYLLITCLCACLIGIVFIFITLLSSNKLKLSRLEEKFPNRRWLQPLLSLIAAIHLYKNKKLIILECFVTSLVTQLALLAIILLLNNMMGLPSFSVFDYMLALAVAQIANLVPLTPGGIGIGEAAFANVLLLLNPGTNAAYATVFLAFRLISIFAYLPGLFIGIFGFNLLKKETYAQ